MLGQIIISEMSALLIDLINTVPALWDCKNHTTVNNLTAYKVVADQ